MTFEVAQMCRFSLGIKNHMGFHGQHLAGELGYKSLMQS